MDFKPGIYQHWKGPLYRALFLAQDSTNYDLGDVHGKAESTEEPMVVYISLDEGEHAGNICVRSLAQWSESVPNPGYDSAKLGHSTVPRFEYLRP